MTTGLIKCVGDGTHKNHVAEINTSNERSQRRHADVRRIDTSFLKAAPMTDTDRHIHDIA